MARGQPPTRRPSRYIGTRTHTSVRADGPAYPERMADNSRRTFSGTSVWSPTLRRSGPMTTKRGRAFSRWLSARASRAQSASRWSAAAIATSSSNPRGPSTVRTTARLMVSMARTARWVRSVERRYAG
ncbi:hypothetical protein [Phycicoccus sp. HDW14]|uniref:hypothetical protein n=1 Tax=Phycicoccus sp. HDW14 TaxID=2714941 RepID=UPI00197C9FEE|nr:hypothetical protein [Phycicoccus sp. HDW14]